MIASDISSPPAMAEIRGRYKPLEPMRRLLHVFDPNTDAASSAWLQDKSSEECEEKPKVALDRNLSHFGYRLLIHVISLALTLAVVQLSFRGVYWFDIGSSPSNLLALFNIDQNEILNGLQFAAKIHEILIACSLSAIALHFTRFRLIGKHGLPLGLLTSAYNVGSLEYLKSKAFLVTGFCRETWVMGIFVASITLLASLVGPSSAIAIIPNLDWWPVPNPFPADMLPVYLVATSEDLWPLHLSINKELNLTFFDCKVHPTNAGCLSAGYEQIQSWAESYVKNLSPVEISMVDQTSNVQRILSAGIPPISEVLEQYDEYVAVSTSPSHFASSALGSFWNFASQVESLLNFNRPRLRTNSLQVLYQPLVQVSCSSFSLGQGSGIIDQNFSSIGFDQFSTSSIFGETLSWPIPDWLYDYNYAIDNETQTALNVPNVNTFEFGNVMNFSWIDLDPSVGGSIGALVIAPYMINDTNTTGHEILGQGGIAYGCTVDARWAGTQLQYDPVSSQTVQHNLTSFILKDIVQKQGTENYTTEYAISPVIQIDSSWANQLNPLIQENGTATTTFQRIFSPFINSINVTWLGPSPHESLLFQFSPPRFSTSDDIVYTIQSADTIALLISLMVTDGLARIGSELYQFVRTNQINSTWSTFTDITSFNGPSSYVPEAPTQDLAGYFSLDFEADRYGYGYGITSSTVQFGIAILITYSTVVTIFLTYISYDFFFGRGWTSSVWGELQELIALAINSPPTDELEHTCTGIEQTGTWRKKIRVREISDNHLGMVVGAPRGVVLGTVMQGKKYGAINMRRND